MEELISEFGRVVVTFSMILPRMMAAFTIVSFMNKELLGGQMVRNSITLSLALFIFPVVESDFPQTLGYAELLFITFKEIFIGIAIGFLTNIIFWAISSVGVFIDNQRGATIAESFDPLLGEQVSPMGQLMLQSAIALFFIGGIFPLFLSGLYGSYVYWPVHEFTPNIRLENSAFFLMHMDSLVKTAVYLAGPAIITMFIVEFGLGLIGRFSPQLNIFFLAMPIKSAVAILVLIIMFGVLMDIFKDYFESTILSNFLSLGELLS